MSSWAITNASNYIQIVSDLQTFRINKFAEITMNVVEPTLYFFYSTNNPELILKGVNNNQNKKALNRRLLEINWNDVTTPVITSATELQTVLNSWIAALGIGNVGYVDVTGSVSFGADRTPSTSSSIMVIASIEISATNTRDSIVEAYVNAIVIANIRLANNASGTITSDYVMTFIVPPDTAYQLLDTGSAAASIITVFELSL